MLSSLSQKLTAARQFISSKMSMQFFRMAAWQRGSYTTSPMSMHASVSGGYVIARTAAFIRTHVETYWKGTSSAAVPHSMSYLPEYILLEECRVRKACKEKRKIVYVDMSVLPLPMRTLAMLIVGRPSVTAILFWSKISLANTGRYRP